uniref:Coiled-coil domain-containing protein 22 homolog n=1 Tax=Aureoumbra lagunensis TaxID=44058 RepID=A0A7S3K6Z1_9STRA
MTIKLGAGAASRHRACAKLASKLLDLGFDGEMGYNQLLYPTPDSRRELLSWLVDRLPRTEEEEQTLASSALDAAATYWQRAASAVAGWRAQAWRLSSCRVPFDKKSWQTWPAEQNEYATQRVPKNCEPTPTLLELAALAQSAMVTPVVGLLEEDEVGENTSKNDARGRTVLGENAADLEFTSDASLRDILAAMDQAKGGDSIHTNTSALGRLAHAAMFTDTIQSQTIEKKETDEDATIKKESIAARLTRELEELQLEFASERNIALELETERETLERTTKPELETKVKALHEQGTKLEQQYTVHRRTLELLPEAAANVTKLQELCLAAEGKLAELEAEWETHRGPLVTEIESKSSEKAKRKQRARAMVDDMKRRRADVRQMLLDLAEKDDRSARLEAEYKKMPKNVNRALYTYRILDIIGSIAKQKKEIHKIIDDIRRVQKQNNKISDTLRRTEAVADERVYQEANAQKQDPAMVQSYRYLSDLRHLFETIVTTISNTGARDREARDHHTKAKQLQSRLDANNLKRVLDDLHQVKTENDTLIARLKGASAPGGK